MIIVPLTYRLLIYNLVAECKEFVSCYAARIRSKSTLFNVQTLQPYNAIGTVIIL